MHELREPRGNFNFCDCHPAHFPRISWSRHWDQALSHMCVLIFGFPAEQDTPGFSQVRWGQIHLGQITMQDPLRLSWVLGSSLEKCLLCFSLLINAIQEQQPVLFSKSLTQSVAPTVAAQGTGKWPHGLLNPSHSSTSPVWHPPAPTATWIKPFTDSFILQKCLSNTSTSRWSHLALTWA